MKQNITTGQVKIVTRFNGLSITIKDAEENVVGIVDSKDFGFKNSKDNTTASAKIVAKSAAQKVIEHDLKEVLALVRGNGNILLAVIETLVSEGIEITRLKDITPIPLNGCKPPKRRY